jgi:3-phosphoglycerate kinase
MEALNINFDWVDSRGLSLKEVILMGNTSNNIMVVKVIKIIRHNTGCSLKTAKEIYYSNIDSWVKELTGKNIVKKEEKNIFVDDIILEMERLKDRYYREAEESQLSDDWKLFDIAQEAIVAINKCIDIVKNKY